MTTYLLLIIGFVILIKGADLLIDGASSLGRRYKVSDLVIGLTIVAFGTSAPEFFVNVIASIQGASGITVGNIFGSNITNILLGLGAVSLMRPLAVEKNIVWREIPMCFVLTLLVPFLVCAWPFQVEDLSRIDGGILLLCFLAFMWYSFKAARHGGPQEEFVPHKEHSMGMSIWLIIIGLAGLSGGGTLIVDNAVILVRRFNISESFIGLSIIALGTSLPEIATSIVAVRKQKVALAVGNVLGSNILNIALVLGVSAVIMPIPFSMPHLIDVGVAIGASLILFLTMFTGKRHSLDRWEGGVCVVCYAAYLAVRFLYQ